MLNLQSASPDMTSDRAAKVMILITEDWFLLSHFKPQIAALVAAFRDVIVVTTSSGRLAEIEGLGARTIAFDFERASFDPVRQAGIVRSLMRLIHAEAPDVVHAIALKPIALGGLAIAASGFKRNKPKYVMHLTGVGFAGTATAGRTPLIYSMTLRLMARLLRSTATALLVENPDDAARVAGPEWESRGNITVLSGAGVDPQQFPAQPLPLAAPPIAGYLGRMVWTKGVDVLVEAHRQLRADHVAIALQLGGTPDAANPRAIAQAQLDEWAQIPGITCRGRIQDASAFWAGTHVAVVPSRGGEGLPRALLEAASTGRALIVTDVPGCRYFVRHETEGLIVPPDNAPALAAALRRFVDTPDLALLLGQNARARLLNSFTEAHVAEAVVATYRRLLQS
jgi:glycosyltransferase involved in cell wall biosynthesis